MRKHDVCNSLKTDNNQQDNKENEQCVTQDPAAVEREDNKRPPDKDNIPSI